MEHTHTAPCARRAAPPRSRRAPLPLAAPLPHELHVSQNREGASRTIN